MMAIQGTKPQTLRSVMGSMCKANVEVKRIAESFLLIHASAGIEGKKRKLEDTSGEALVPKYDTCAHCDEEFDVSLNKGKVCDWHIGT
jgi:hypothetical protein